LEGRAQQLPTRRVVVARCSGHRITTAHRGSGCVDAWKPGDSGGTAQTCPRRPSSVETGMSEFGRGLSFGDTVRWAVVCPVTPGGGESQMVQVVGRQGRRRLSRGSASDRRLGLFAAALTAALALGACTSSGGGSGS